MFVCTWSTFLICWLFALTAHCQHIFIKGKVQPLLLPPLITLSLGVEVGLDSRNSVQLTGNAFAFTNGTAGAQSNLGSRLILEYRYYLKKKEYVGKGWYVSPQINYTVYNEGNPDEPDPYFDLNRQNQIASGLTLGYEAIKNNKRWGFDLFLGPQYKFIVTRQKYIDDNQELIYLKNSKYSWGVRTGFNMIYRLGLNKKS